VHDRCFVKMVGRIQLLWSFCICYDTGRHPYPFVIHISSLSTRSWEWMLSLTLRPAGAWVKLCPDDLQQICSFCTSSTHSYPNSHCSPDPLYLDLCSPLGDIHFPLSLSPQSFLQCCIILSSLAQFPSALPNQRCLLTNWRCFPYMH